MALTGHTTEISCLNFNKDENKVFSGSAGGTIYAWDLAGMRAASKLTGHLTTCLCVTPGRQATTDSYIVSGANDTQVKLWDTRTKACA